MWSALHALSKSYFYFIVGFSVYGAIATHRYDEILGPALVCLIWFPLWGLTDLFSDPSFREGSPIWFWMKLNSWLFWLNFALIAYTGSKTKDLE